MTKVYFIGAGPGDPKLITVKGKEVLEKADIIIYTGSLVNKEVLNYRKENAKVYNSAGMDRVEIESLIREGIKNEKTVVRLHTGDPSLYGAMQEQIEWLEEEKLPLEVIPGVSAFSGAAAALKREYTLPGVTQTLVITRLEGRTPGASPEMLRKLASTEASLCFFLSTSLIDKAVAILLETLPPHTPAAVVYKATWPEEKILKGTLNNIEDLVKEAGITKTALILVGKFLTGQGEKSKLYDPEFSHEYRK